MFTVTVSLTSDVYSHDAVNDDSRHHFDPCCQLSSESGASALIRPRRWCQARVLIHSGPDSVPRQIEHSSSIVSQRLRQSCPYKDFMLNHTCSAIVARLRAQLDLDRSPNDTRPMARVSRCSFRKEVIQPHLPVRLPCYDFVPITDPTFDSSLLAVRPPASGVTDFRDVTGGVYKARERIHRSVADLRLLATPTSWGRVADPNPN